jgi:hypothetical protein
LITFQNLAPNNQLLPYPLRPVTLAFRYEEELRMVPKAKQEKGQVFLSSVASLANQDWTNKLILNEDNSLITYLRMTACVDVNQLAPLHLWAAFISTPPGVKIATRSFFSGKEGARPVSKP